MMTHDDLNIDRVDSLYQISPAKPANQNNRQRKQKALDDKKKQADKEAEKFGSDDLTVTDERHELDFQA